MCDVRVTSLIWFDFFFFHNKFAKWITCFNQSRFCTYIFINNRQQKKSSWDYSTVNRTLIWRRVSFMITTCEHRNRKKVTHAYRIGAVYYVYTYNLIYRGCGQISCCLVQGCLLLDIVCQKTKTIRHQYILNHDIWPWVEVKIVLYSVYRKVTYGVRQRHSSRGVISHENILIRVYTIVRMYECTNVRGHGHARRARRHDFANITALTSHSSTCAMHESSHRIGASCDKQLSRAGWMCMATTFALIVTMNDAFIVCAFQFPFHMICVVWWRWWLLILISIYSCLAGWWLALFVTADFSDFSKV